MKHESHSDGEPGPEELFSFIITTLANNVSDVQESTKKEKPPKTLKTPKTQPLRIRKTVKSSINFKKRLAEFRRKSLKMYPETNPPFKKIRTIKDLLNIAWRYTGDAFDRQTLWRLIPELQALNNMCGLHDLKDQIVKFIVYSLLGLREETEEDDQGESLGIVFQGPPGTGKTRSAKIVAKIFYKLGIIPTDEVLFPKKEDFMGKYVGHTESQTAEIFNNAIGKVMFIDEAYFGAGDKTDSFVTSFVNMLNQFIWDKRGQFVPMIAGYKEQLDRNLFDINPGLRSRFLMFVDTGDYKPVDMTKMFRNLVCAKGWELTDEAREYSKRLFEEKLETHFKYFGRDVDNYFIKCKEEYSSRMLGISDNLFTITKEDMVDALEEFSKDAVLSGDHEKDEFAGEFLRTFKHKIETDKWDLEVKPNVIKKCVFEKKFYFKYMQEDIEDLFECCKTVYMTESDSVGKRITEKLFLAAFDRFIKKKIHFDENIKTRMYS